MSRKGWYEKDVFPARKPGKATGSAFCRFVQAVLLVFIPPSAGLISINDVPQQLQLRILSYLNPQEVVL